MSIPRLRWAALGLLVVCLLALGRFNHAVAQSSNPTVRQIIVPDEDTVCHYDSSGSTSAMGQQRYR